MTMYPRLHQGMQRSWQTIGFHTRGSGFIQSLSETENNILIPKYYDPEIQNELEGLRNTHDLVPIGEFVEQKVLNITTGVEVGRLSYGTGSIPFIRTSDMGELGTKDRS